MIYCFVQVHNICQSITLLMDINIDHLVIQYNTAPKTQYIFIDFVDIC